MKRADPSWFEQKGVMQSTGTDFKQTLAFSKEDGGKFGNFG